MNEAQRRQRVVMATTRLAEEALMTRNAIADVVDGPGATNLDRLHLATIDEIVTNTKRLLAVVTEIDTSLANASA